MPNRIWSRFTTTSPRSTPGKILFGGLYGASVFALYGFLEALGAPRFYDAIRAFGIGQATGIELPGENRGLLRPLENWSASSIGSLAMGQEVSVTPIQIVSAISAVANGGTLYRPHIVREIDGGECGRSPGLTVTLRASAGINHRAAAVLV